MTNRWAIQLSPFALAFSAATATLVVIQFVLNWIVVCGTSSTSVLGLLCGVATGFATASLTNSRISPPNRTLKYLLSAGAMLLVWLAPSVLDGLLGLGTSITSRFGLSSGLSFALPMCFAGAVTWVTAQWWQWHSPATASRATRLQFAGVALGCLLPLVNGIVMFSMAWLTSGWIAVAAILCYVTQNEPRSDSSRNSFSLEQILSAATVALFAHAVVRFTGFLSPLTVPLVLIAGAIAALAIAAQQVAFVQRLLDRREVPWLVLGFMCLLPLTFPLVAQLNLQWNASVNSSWQILLLRAFQLSLGIIVASLVMRHGRTAEVDFSSAFGSLAAFSLGLAVGGVLETVGISVGVQMILASSIAAALYAKERRLRPAWTGGMLAIALICSFFVRIDSTVTSQTLFSARTAVGLRNGLSLDFVEQSQCTRLLDDFVSETGHMTVWKTSADMVEVRRNGIPNGLVSTNELTTPQPVAEVLTTVIPLTMHRHPREVLLLCDDTGVGTRVCCNFPLAHIETVVSDKRMTEFAARYVWNSLATPPQEDDRVSIVHESIATAIRRVSTSTKKLDVVIAASPNPISLLCQHQLTQEFYRNVRNSLTSSGVFCQRITQHDLGAAPIHKLLSTLSSVFPRVVVVQMSPGEMALVASASEDDLLDAGLLDRMQRAHVQRELGRSGWDWSQLAALPVVDTRDQMGIYEHMSPTDPLTAANTYFALAIPFESARWGDKPGEIRALFAPHQLRLADATPRSEAYKEYARRFSAVVQQMEIVTTLYDEPWPYRQSLKSEMQRNPRPAIESPGNGGIKKTIDPRDSYRKDYFITLGSVLKQAQEGFADPLALKQLTKFTLTYEPLISYFAHHELIRIHESTGHPGPAMELRHRLHTVFFSDGRDFSIRQVTAAMEQILEDPNLLPSDEARFDHLNAMLQELVRRWEGRRSWSPPSARRTQADIDRSIKVANRALDEIGELAPIVAMSRKQFLARRRFINKSLVGPLRSYSEQVLAHRIKTEAPSGSSELLADDELPMLLGEQDDDGQMTN